MKFSALKRQVQFMRPALSATVAIAEGDDGLPTQVAASGWRERPRRLPVEGYIEYHLTRLEWRDRHVGEGPEIEVPARLLGFAL
jgi:hypothetical protein